MTRPTHTAVDSCSLVTGRAPRRPAARRLARPRGRPATRAVTSQPHLFVASRPSGSESATSELHSVTGFDSNWGKPEFSGKVRREVKPEVGLTARGAGPWGM
eukprot:3669934-Rhodomonas_salina.1